MLCFCFCKAYPRRQTKKNSLATEHKGSGKLAQEEVSLQLKFYLKYNHHLQFMWYQLNFGKPMVNTLVWKGIDSFNKYSDVQDKKISRYEAPDAIILW